MLQILELQQLQALSQNDLEKVKTEANNRKTDLERVKKDKRAWTEDLQKELNSVALYLVDIDDTLEEIAKKNAYTVRKGSEKMLHLRLARGHRYNPRTGKEESKPYVQLFSYSEWQLFKKYHKNLGFSILEVLHDPWGEAKDYVTAE